MSRQAPRHIPTIVGTNLRFAREAKSLNQRALAKALDIEAFQISRWERGVHRPSDETLFAIADELDVDYAWFFTDRDGVVS